MPRQRSSGDVPPPLPDPTAALVAALGRRLLGRADELGTAMAEAIVATIPAYADSTLVPLATLRASCRAQVEAILRAIGDEPGRHAGDTRAVGRARAQAGVPLTAVMDAFRLGGQQIWAALAAAALADGAPPAALVRAASDMWVVLDTFTQAMAEGYRDEITEQVLGTEQRRSALVQALLAGRLDADTSLWDVAQALRLPAQGPYLVVAATVHAAGQHVLPQVERRLRTAGFTSAWLLEHDAQLGVVAPAEGSRRRGDPAERLAAGLAAASVPEALVGVSPAYERLADTPAALRLARIALQGATAQRPVALFDADPLAVAAVAEPDVMRRLAGRALAGLDPLTPRDRRVLLETVGTWLDSGSADAVAAALFVHPNTVRHRLRRVESLTGRSLAEPRWVAELALAYEVDRRSGPLSP